MFLTEITCVLYSLSWCFLLSEVKGAPQMLGHALGSPLQLAVLGRTGSASSPTVLVLLPAESPLEGTTVLVLLWLFLCH